MASAKLKKKTINETFLSPEQTRTIKPADFKNHQKLKDLSQDDLIELLCLMEAELQAKDVLLKAILCGKAGVALPLSQLLNDVETAALEENEAQTNLLEEEDEIWLGEPSAHLNHVSAYHQVVREQMQSIVETLQSQHKKVVDQLDEERHKHAADTAQGDDVTYMLEKERERLQLQVEAEQVKYEKLEKERDALLKVIETERREQYNTFNSLMNDCKAFALQLVQQTTKLEKYQKDIDKEKQKNKVLSELMVNETQKFKDRLKLYEDEVNDFHVLEQKKADLEVKLQHTEKECKETYRHLNEERIKNGKLRYQLNQLRKQLPDSAYDFDDGGEDVLLVQDQIEIPFRQARTSAIQLSNESDRESPEPSSMVPPGVAVQSAKVATVQKSSSVKQNKVLSPHGKQGLVVSVNSLNQNPNFNSYADNHKRHSFEERTYSRDYGSEDGAKRNSYEGTINHVNYEGVETAQLRTTNTMRYKHNSYEEVRNVGSPSLTLKRNSYEGDTKKVAPAPPRRGSSLKTPDKPPVVKIPQQLQPRKTNQSNSLTYAQSRAGSADETVPLMLVVVCAYGSELRQDAEEEMDFLSLIHVTLSCSWYELTCLINEAFEKESLVRMNEDEDPSSDSIASYEYNNVLWTMLDYPTVSLYNMLSLAPTSHVIIRIKGIVENCFDDLSYSTMISNQALEESIRIIYQEKKLMLTVNEEREGEHFTSCISQWIQRKEEQKDIRCNVIKVNHAENRNVSNLINTLRRYGILQDTEQEDLKERFILILNVDYMEREGFTSVVLDLLTHSPEKKTSLSVNGYHEEECHCLHKDVFVMAYVTSDRVNTLTQSSYRLFKIISLPLLLPGLVHRWLREKIIQHSAKTADKMEMNDTVKWLSNVYHSLHKSFFKIELAHKLPDISVYIDAPISDRAELLEWTKQLWTESIVPCVEDSVRKRTGGVAGSQQQILIKATLKTLYERDRFDDSWNGILALMLLCM
ncbi:uncharacterized protein LOC130624973 isoform X2 [Hydractinia symbiolongicarpus]|uniref:uncharacterized protein LOC130624973 isoform X2 n=1 Tax=Hydractinia symbiolongicarpus TaxID=13093 RepID=UPI002550BF17|nr:uncharacterized protein LOC130624973 isoform X2 [Hydractinia symbiolongicarpus]